MHKIWLIFDPLRSLIAFFGYLAVLALLIHLILLSTANFNWLDTASAKAPISRPVRVAVVKAAAPVAAPVPAAVIKK